MLRKHASQYSDEELTTLVEDHVRDRVPECKELDYKQTIDLDNREARREAARDISSFANTVGGTVIYGIPEERQGREAVPARPYGMTPIQNFQTRFENSLVDSLRPRLPDLCVREVPVSGCPDRVVYVVWHPGSWLAPHMVESYGDFRYWRRGELRAVEMSEFEVRQKYEEVQRTQSHVQDFLNSDQVDYICRLFGSNFSQAIACPLMLINDRVHYNETGMRDWLVQNHFPHESNQRQGFGWYPSLLGAQVGGIPESREPVFRAELHHNGSINAVWKTDVTVKMLSEREILQFWEFFRFASNFYKKIGYHGPLHFRFRITGLRGVEFLGNKNSLPGDEFRCDYAHSSTGLMEEPAGVLTPLADRLYQAYGRWAAPLERLKSVTSRGWY